MENQPRAPLPDRMDAARAWWNRRSRAAFVAQAVLVTLAVSLLRFSPKLWLFSTPGDNLEWSRALDFLRQCQDPFSVAVAPAIRWRLLPPLVAHGLGLAGRSALVLPYAGLLAFLAYWVMAAERVLGDRLNAVFLTLLVASSGAVLTVTGWLGMNDGWYLLGLTALAAGTSWPSLLFSGLLTPWVDERFLLAWPLALACRYALQRRSAGFTRHLLTAALSLVPYVAVRLAFSALHGDRGSAGFGLEALRGFRHYLAYIYLGWWMGLRAGWVLVAVALRTCLRESPSAGRTLVAAALLALGSATLLAADLSRSTGVLLPLLLVGAAGWPQRERLSVWLGGLSAANLIIPFSMVVDTKVVPAWSLPIELFRLLRGQAL